MSDIASKLFHKYWPTQNPLMADEAEDLVRAIVSDMTKLRPANEYRDDMGDVLWFIKNKPYEVNHYDPRDRGAATTHFQQINVNEPQPTIKENQ